MSLASFEQALRKDLPHHWLATEAEVTYCAFAPARVYGSADGLDEQLPHYTVGFTYSVAGKTYDGVLSSPVEVEPHDTFALHYNPTDPKENNSLASELDRPWYTVYMVLFGAVIVGALIYGLVQRYLLHR